MHHTRIQAYFKLPFRIVTPLFTCLITHLYCRFLCMYFAKPASDCFLRGEHMHRGRCLMCIKQRRWCVLSVRKRWCILLLWAQRSLWTAPSEPNACDPDAVFMPRVCGLTICAWDWRFIGCRRGKRIFKEQSLKSNCLAASTVLELFFWDGS